MGLSLKALSEGREIVHDVAISALGDTVKIRELSTVAIEKIFNAPEYEVPGNDNALNEQGVKAMLRATLTDDDNTEMSDEMCVLFFKSNQTSVIKEITQKIIEIHGGSNEGEP